MDAKSVDDVVGRGVVGPELDYTDFEDHICSTIDLDIEMRLSQRDFKNLADTLRKRGALYEQ